MFQDTGLIHTAGTFAEHFQNLAISISDGDGNSHIWHGIEFTHWVAPGLVGAGTPG